MLHLGGASEDRIYFGTDTRLEAIAIGVLAAVWYARSTREGSAAPAWWGRDRVLVAALVLYLGSVLIREELFRETLRYSVQAVAAVVNAVASVSLRVCRVMLNVRPP